MTSVIGQFYELIKLTDMIEYKKVTMKCGHCKQEGHSKRTCPTMTAATAATTTAATTTAATTTAATTTNTYVKPPLKWVGSKQQIMDEVLALYPTQMNNYIEPFLGGGSVLLGLLSLRQQGKIQINGNLYASDSNPNIIGLYQNIQSHCEELIDALQTIVTRYSAIQGTTVNRNATTLEEALSSRESYYYWTRFTFNGISQDKKVSPRGSAMLLFLNKTCFRGVYREGPHGLNVPFEKQHQNPTIFDAAHLRQVSELIQGVRFTCQGFEASMAIAEKRDVVYLDPPYVPETTTSFVGYTVDGFSAENHALLFYRMDGLAEKGVHVIMSNADVPLVREAFPEPYHTQVISVRRAIHSKKPDSTTNEVLITNKK
jgi:DNA adenine methylase